MLVGEITVDLPAQLVIFSQGKQGTGALPLANAVLTTPAFSTLAPAQQDYINPPDGTIKRQDLGTGANALKRFAGVWYLDVSLFQDVKATVQLQERVIDRQTGALGGNATWNNINDPHQARPNIPLRFALRVANCEIRVVYTNGPTNTAKFDFFVGARSL